MTFPQTVLPLLVELNLDGTWTDVTSYVRRSDGVSISRGRSDEASVVDTSSCSMTLDNRDGRFSPHDPEGAYYGQIGRNTPIRVVNKFAATAPTFDASSTDNGTGDLSWTHTPVGAPNGVTVAVLFFDVGGISSLTATYGGEELELVAEDAYNAGGGVAGVIYVWHLGRDVPSGAQTVVIEGGSVQATSVAVSTTGDYDTYFAGIHESDGSTANPSDSFTAELSSFVVGLVDSSVDAVGSISPGTGHSQLIEFAFGSEVVSWIRRDSAVTGAGTTSWTATASNWNAYSFLIASGASTRFTGEISSWTKVADLTGTDVYTRIECAGILRRLGQGDPVNLPSYKDYLLTTDPWAYWPLDEGSRKKSGDNASSHTTSRFQIQAKANFTFGEGDLGDTLPAGLKLVTTVTEQSAGNFVFLPFLGTGYAFDYVWKSASPGSFYWGLVDNIGAQYFILFRHDGINNDVQVLYQDTPDSGGAITSLGSTGLLTIFDDDELHHVRFQLQEDGSDLDWTVFVDGTSEASGIQTSKDEWGVQRIGIFYDPGEGTGVDDVGTEPVALGHVGLWTSDYAGDPPVLDDVMELLSGHDGETAGRRIERVADDAGISIHVVGDLDDTERMGPQVDGQNPLSIIRDCETVDGGILYEPRESTSLVYRTRKSLYAQTSAFTGDYEAHEFTRPLDPVADDQALRNNVVASMPDGGSVEVELETGALSTQDPPNGVGKYRTNVSLNVEGDGQLLPQASWRLALGTQDEPRYPALGFNLAHEAFATDEDQTAALAGLDVGDRLAITNPPSWVSADDVTQLAQGFTERLSNFEWTIDVNAVPAGVYDVPEYQTAAGDAGADGRARFDARGSELHGAIDSDDTQFGVRAGDTLWTTDVAEFPFDIVIGGERMTVTGVSGATSPQTFTVTRSVNGISKSHADGAAVRLFHTPRFGL